MGINFNRFIPYQKILATMKHHYGWIIILLGALVVACSASAQAGEFYHDTTGTFTVDTGTIRHDEFIMMEIVSIKKPCLHFFKKGYKRGDKYWYFDGRRVKPLPKNWMVWEYREIKE